MKTERYIAKRLYFLEEHNERSSNRMSRPAVRVALGGIIIGMVVMIVTIFVIIGFKQTVREKVIGLGAHIQVVNFDNNNTFEMKPILITDTLLSKIRSIPEVSSADVFATKTGIIKTDVSFQGIVLKGYELSSEHNEGLWNFWKNNLRTGRLPQKENEVLISENMSHALNLKADTTFLCYFVQDNIRVRKLYISGTYCTDVTENDNLFVIGCITPIQKLNGWESNQASGIDVRIHDFNKLEQAYNRVYFATANKFDDEGNGYYAQNVIDLNPAIFSWLDLLDMNALVIILLMLAVSGFNIISGLLILILDGINLIGTLKSLGANNRFIRRIFLYEATMLIGKGMIIGNLIGLALCAIQYWLHIVPLDPSVYYVSYAPICFSWGWWLLLNAGTLIVSVLMLLWPSLIITRISPSQVMKFE